MYVLAEKEVATKVWVETVTGRVVNGSEVIELGEAGSLQSKLFF